MNLNFWSKELLVGMKWEEEEDFKCCYLGFCDKFKDLYVEEDV